MGVGVLAKGPVGFVLPTAVIGMYLLIKRLPHSQPAGGERDLKTHRSTLPLWRLAEFAAALLRPWLASVASPGKESMELSAPCCAPLCSTPCIAVSPCFS